MRFRILHGVLLLVALGLWARPAAGGQWIVPGEKAVKPFEAVELYTPAKEEQCPLVYRTVVEVPEGTDRISAVLRTTQWAYVCVDGRQVFAWAPPSSRPSAAQAQVYKAQFHRLDLTDELPPGRHVLTISASGDGLVLDGAMYGGTQRLAKLVSDETWTATLFAPTTILEFEPIMTPGYDGAAVPDKASAAIPVAAQATWAASEDALALVHFQGRLKAFRHRLDELNWALRQFAEQGVYRVGDQARHWGGAQRLDAGLLEQARKGLTEVAKADVQLGQLGKQAVRSQADLDRLLSEIESLALKLQELESGLKQAWSAAAAADDAKELALIRQAIDTEPSGPKDGPAAQLRQLEQQLGHTLAPLNSSRYDRMGWLPYARLTDSDLSRWGVRVNGGAGAKEVATEGWAFRTDPGDAGVAEQWWRSEVHSDRPWTAVELPHNWAQGEDPELRTYTGAAWYRGRLALPSNWAGQPIKLTITIGGTERLWVNGREVSERGLGQRRRHYTLSPDELAFGGDNTLVVRVQSNGPWRGLLGKPTAAWARPEAREGQDVPPVDVLATPLSPCVILRPRTSELQIHHAGKAALGLPGKGEILAAEQYSDEEQGQLAANWVLLWLRPAGPADVRRPILLIFERNPQSITAEPGVTKITLREGPQQVVAVRPWARHHPGGIIGSAELMDHIDFWSRAARAIPVNYATITRVARRGGWSEKATVENMPVAPVLDQTIVYDYLETTDTWRTPPLKVAPVPALCAYAMGCKYPELEVDGADAIQSFQDGGAAGGYYAIREATSIRYRYPIEPFGRLMGFSQPMLEDYAVGFSGNKRQAQIIAEIGANSLRAIHNWSDEAIGAEADEDNPPRLVTLANACRAAGINLTTVCDEGLGRRPQRLAREYGPLTEELSDHYKKIAMLLAGRPFSQAAYGLVDAPIHHSPRLWGPAAAKTAERIRVIDSRHLITIESPDLWRQVDGIDPIMPTGDPLMLYGFGDDTPWLVKAADRWPDSAAGRDIGAICELWWPAIAYSLRHGVPLHCTRFGNFGEATNESPAQRAVVEDYLSLFDQFGMHAHYATQRTSLVLQADGSLRPAAFIRPLGRYLRSGALDRYSAGAAAEK